MQPSFHLCLTILKSARKNTNNMKRKATLNGLGISILALAIIASKTAGTLNTVLLIVSGLLAIVSLYLLIRQVIEEDNPKKAKVKLVILGIFLAITVSLYFIIP